MKYQYCANGDTKTIEGISDTIVEAKQIIRKKMKGQKLNWEDDVSIIEGE